MPIQTAADSISNSAGSPYGFKNRIINGAMAIDQRNVGTSVTAGGQYILDRWIAYSSQASKYTVQQNAGSVTPPTGFQNYLGVTVGASASVTVGSSDYFDFAHLIEGYNVADLDFGTSNAKTFTLSFWVRSSVTGAFGGGFRNFDGTRNYPFSYTINSANTWEYKTIIVAGDTSGTWPKTNGIGLNVTFSIGMGSNYSGTAGAWTSSGVLSPTGSTNLISTNSATFYVTGVQVEIGAQATAFDWRPYGTELLLCQRYYSKTFVQTTAPAQNAGYTGTLMSVGTGGKLVANWNYPATMRAIPTITAYSPADASSNWYSAAGPTSIASLAGAGTTSAYLYDSAGNASNPYQYWIHATASAEY